MASRASIEFDFHKAKAQADKLDSIADQLSRLADSKFGNTMQHLSSNWKGENASLYLDKGGRLQEQMDGTAGELHSIASDIRAIARRIYEAEMNALRIAEQREY